MNSEPAPIVVSQLSKTFHRFNGPWQRLRQIGRRMLGRAEVPGARAFTALQPVSFEVRRGETMGIIGRNGAGKSTLLQLICGTLHPSSGQVRVHGRVAALLELGAGFHPEYSGRDNIRFTASLYGLDPATMAERMSAIEAFAGIGDFIEQPVKTYSSGMLVRLAFALIAHVDADILIIDEALAVGDAVFTQKCMGFLRNFMRNGTLLFVSHETAAVKSLCSRVLWLDRGEVRMHGEPKQVCEAYLEACLLETPGTQVIDRGASVLAASETTPARDQRADLINSSTLRCDLRVFEFDERARGLGVFGASIVEVSLHDLAGRRLGWVVGGETVRLRIRVRCHQALASPVIGFMVKDRVAQPLFGDNTYLRHVDAPVSAGAGDTLLAEFCFDMPRLPVGDYAIIVAIADGDQNESVQHHWMHDALQFRSECSSVASGMIGLPMREILLQRQPAPQTQPPAVTSA